jgi:translocation and assembly module TamB
VRGFALENAALDGYLQGSEVRVERFSATSHRALLEAGGAFAFGDAGGTGTLELLRLSRDGNALALEAPADFAFGHRAASLAPLTLAGNVGMLELSLEREGDALEAFAHARELDLNPLLPDHGLGQAQGQIALQRIGERFSLGVQASLAGWSIPGFDGRVGAEIDLEQSDQRLDVRRFDLATTGGERFSFAGAAPVDWSQWPPLVDGPIAFRASTAGVPLARLRLPPPWDAIAREASGNFAFDLAGETAAPIGRIEVDLAELAWADETSGELKATLVLAADGVRAELDAVQPGRFSADGTAALDAPLDLGALLAREFAGLLDAPLAASFNLRAADLAWLGERLPGVRRSGGSMVADVNVEGSLRERSWSGRLVVAGGEVKFDSDLPALALVRGALHLEGGEVRLAGVTAELGGAPIQVGGTFSLPTGGPVALDLTLRGERLLLRRDPEVLLRADADLRLTGTWLTPALNGTLSLRRSFWTKRITLGDLQSGGASSSARGIPLFSFREAPFRDMTLALRVDSVEPLVLRGNIARGGLRPELMITGTGEVPRVEGRVYLEASTLSLPGGVLDFRGGTLTFDPRNPFVPSLSLVGTTEKFGHDITAVVTGPYDRPEVELTSTPPLSSEDIVLILLAGRPPTGFAEGGAIEATQNVAIFLANDFASAWLGGSDQGGESFLQRVEVISGREISRNGVPTLEIRLRVSEDYLLDESRTYLSYERDVYEDQNLGVRFAVRLR